MTWLALLLGVPLAVFLFWRGTRYFWLKHYYHHLGVRDVDARTANGWLDDDGTLLLDVREPDEYAAGHIAQAWLIPLGELPQRLDELRARPYRRLVVVCRGGVRSAKACLILGEAGFDNPLNLAGGVRAWTAAGLPYVTPA